MTTPHDHSTNPLHGITLERMLNELVADYGWARMGRKVKILCFTSDPSIGSSLAFLRRTPWARAKVEAMYLDMKRRNKKAADAAAERLGD
ncbi:MAG: VF530 family protein [Gemmatimonadetes bacterium]|nr:VF530 family protein [Gemmatimonadota bacterium]